MKTKLQFLDFLPFLIVFISHVCRAAILEFTDEYKNGHTAEYYTDGSR